MYSPHVPLIRNFFLQKFMTRNRVKVLLHKGTLTWHLPVCFCTQILIVTRDYFPTMHEENTLSCITRTSRIVPWSVAPGRPPGMPRGQLRLLLINENYSKRRDPLSATVPGSVGRNSWSHRKLAEMLRPSDIKSSSRRYTGRRIEGLEKVPSRRRGDAARHGTARRLWVPHLHVWPCTVMPSSHIKYLS